MNPQDYNQNPYNSPQNQQPSNGYNGYNPQPSNFEQTNFGGQNTGANPQVQNWDYSQNAGQFSNDRNPQFNNGQIPNLPNYPQQNFNPQPQPIPQNQTPTHLLPNQQYSAKQSENPYTVEYLNSIAPKQKEPFWTKGKIGLALFAGLGLIFSLGFLLFADKGDSHNEAITRVYYHIVNLDEVAKKQQKRLKSSNLSALNAGISTSFSTNKTSMAEFMTSRKIEVLKDSRMKKAQLFEKVSKDYKKLDEILEDAFLKTTLDEVYSREMSYQIAVVKTHIEKLKNILNSKKANETLDEIIANFETSIKGLNEFKE